MRDGRFFFLLPRIRYSVLIMYSSLEVIIPKVIVLQFLSLCHSSIYPNIAITERNIHCHEGILSLQLVKYKRKGYIPPMVLVL